MLFLILILYALFASTFTLAKAGLFFAKPLFLITCRMIIAGSLMLLYVHFCMQKKIHVARKYYGLMIQAIIFHIFLSFALEFSAMQYLTSSKACLLYSLSPFVAALFSYFSFNERMTFKKFLGLFIGFAGFIPTIVAPAWQEGFSWGFLSGAELMLILSVVFSTYGWIVVRQLVQAGYSTLLINGIAMLGGGLLSGISSIYFENALHVPAVFDTQRFFVILVAQIIIASGICYNLYAFLLNYYTATFLAFAGFICPLFAAFFGWLFLHEIITWHYFFTSAAVCVGLYLFYQEELRQGYVLYKK